jgi:hypothetical protein
MGYILFWVEDLAVLLLAVALVIACVGRLRRPWLRHGLWAIAFFVLFLPLAWLTLSMWMMVFQHQTWAIKWFVGMLALTISFLVGSLWLRIAGLRRVADAPAPTVAGVWPRGKLAACLAIAVALHLMTLWNLDLAARQQLETLRVEAGQLSQSVAPPPLTDRDNAAPLYEQAAEAMGPKDKWPKAFAEWIDPARPRDAGSQPPLSPALRRVVHDWRSVLVLAHEAASKPGYYVDREYFRPAIDIQLSDLERMGYVANLLTLDGHEKVASGDVRGAIEDITTQLAMARHVAGEPFVVAVLLSAGLEGNALDALQKLLKQRAVPVADLAAVRIQTASSYRKLTARALRTEEALMLAAIFEIGEGRLCATLHEPEDHPLLDAIFAPIYRVFLLPGEVETSRLLWRQMREAAKSPYREGKPIWQRCEAETRSSGGIVLNEFMFAASNCATAVSQGDARRQTARLGVAAYLYREKSGHWPEKLADLVPEFIPSLPPDPFDGKPIRLKRTAHGMVVYSVGPDLVDNGGTPIDWKTQKGDIVFELADRKR